jgi:hypothetical protein
MLRGVEFSNVTVAYAAGMTSISLATLRIQFRTEFFNLTNAPTFLLPSSNSPGMTCMGRAPGTACNDTNPQFGKLSNSSTTGRQIQFGLKVIF